MACTPLKGDEIILCTEATLVNYNNERTVAQMLYCRSWSCEICQPRRQAQLVAKAKRGLPDTPLNPRLNFQMRVRVTSGGVTLEDKTEPIDLKVGEPQDVMLGFGFRIFPATTGSIAWSWRIDTAGIPLINIDDCQLAISDDGPF